MSEDSQSRKTYHRHRENQRERILDAAEELFLEHGIDTVTLGQISRSARISRMTLYEYFPDKAEIAWAIFQKIIDDASQATAPEVAALSGSGYERLARYIEMRIKNFFENTREFRYIALFNYLYAREGSPQRMRGMLEQALSTASNTERMLRDGISDGSIRPDIQPGLTAAALGNLMAGITSRFALLGANIPEEYGYGLEELAREIFTNFILGLRAHPE